MGMKHQFTNLEIWLRSITLAKDIYTITKQFPSDERFGLIEQIRQCSVSVPSNIADGCGKGTNPQLIYLLDKSTGCLCKLETQFLISTDQNYLDSDQADPILDEIIEIRKMIYAFKKTLT